MFVMEQTAVEQAIAESIVAEPAPAREGELLDPRVLRGCEVLDARFPGWAQRIDLETLKLDATRRCVIGQLFGSYDSHWEHLLDIPNSREARSDHGFTTANSDDSWETLEQDWRIAIAERCLG